MGGNEGDTALAERVLVMTRVFDAPRAQVFRAWTDPAQTSRWMGPRGFTATYLTQDLRPGGAWRTCLRRDDDGKELWQGGTYHEVVPPERLVFSFAWDGEDGHPGNQTLVTILFEDRDGKTAMTFRQATFDTTANRDGHHGGWTSSFDRLAEHLAQH